MCDVPVYCQKIYNSFVQASETGRKTNFYASQTLTKMNLTEKIGILCGKRNWTLLSQMTSILMNTSNSFNSMIFFQNMYSQNRFYVSSVRMINCEILTLHNENCIVTLSIIIYIYCLVTSKNMLMKFGSTIKSSKQCYSF